jgi:hypothetical protein
MKKHIIIQRFGLGDHIFSMGAIRMLDGVVIWPTLPEYVEGHSRAYPDIVWVDWNLINLDWNRKDRYMLGGLDVIPLAHQDVPITSAMKNKHAYLGLDWRDWKTGAMWHRDYEKEAALLAHLNIKDGDQFALINVNFGCWSKAGLRSGSSKAYVGVSTNLRQISLDFLPGFSLFDWAGVIERASYIASVSTSLLYLLELLELKASEVHLFPRLPYETNFANVSYIFTKTYILHA